MNPLGSCAGWAFLSALSAVLIPSAGAAGPAAPDEKGPPPWVHAFVPVRTFFVAPEGTGSGASAEAPLSWRGAVETAQPGDLYWLLEGRYPGRLDFARSGERERPIVYRALPGRRATVVGNVGVRGAYTWLWGIEFIDPEPLRDTKRYDTHAIRVGAAGAHLINNVIHNCGGGIGGWMAGPDTVFYGNIIYGMGGDGERPRDLITNYPTYTQNDYDRDGYKYWVQNMFFDATPTTPAYGYNFHAYTQEGAVSGFFLKQNLFVGGQMIIGSTKRPPHHNVVIENCFYRSMRARLGFTTPTQAEFRANYLVDTCLDYVEVPGEGEKRLPMPLPTVVSDNEIYAPEWAGSHVYFRTSAWLDGETLTRGDPRIPPEAVWDRNTYSEPVHIASHAGGTDHGVEGSRRAPGPLDLAAWQAATATAGKRFDAEARAVPLPTAPRVFVFTNEYEPGRAHIIIYNWSRADDVPVDLSKALAPGARFAIYPAKAPFGPPVAGGRYEAPVAVPMGGEAFGAFLVVSPAEAE